MRRAIIGLFAIGCLCSSAFSAIAAEGTGEEKQPDATLELTSKSIAIGIGYSWGSGNLKFQGQEYPVSVSGLAVGGVGFKEASAFGKVYNLKTLADFDGTYSGVGAGGTLGGGAEAMRIKNAKGVLIVLYTRTEGLSLSLASGGAKLEIKKP
jgi:hypothetical protein